MASFGLGTLPSVLALGVVASGLTRFAQRPAVRALAGVLVAVLGVLQVWRALTS
jgi:sulfite exporter TauE/SafE